MKTVNEIRTENLNALAREYGGPIAFADFIGKDRSQVSQWLNNTKDSKTGKPRYISSASCRQVEAKCGKESGWLDTQHNSATSESAPSIWPFSISRHQFDQLPVSEKNKINDFIEYTMTRWELSRKSKN